MHGESSHLLCEFSVSLCLSGWAWPPNIKNELFIAPTAYSLRPSSFAIALCSNSSLFGPAKATVGS
jgi:hypothetical protein